MILDLRGTLRSTRPRNARLVGYSVDAPLGFEERFNDDDGEALRVPVGGSARVGEAGSWTIRVAAEGEGNFTGPVAFTVSAPDGTQALRQAATLEEGQSRSRCGSRPSSGRGSSPPRTQPPANGRC
jgi:hypothetical protein